MIGYTLRNLGARRRRAAMTALAILLGVSMISGTYIFTDTIHSAFRLLFSGATRGTTVVVSSRQNLGSPVNAPAKTHVAIVSLIRALPGVAGAEGEISNVATIIGRNGKPIENTYAPTLGLSYVPPQFGRFSFVAGSPPTRPGQVAIDQATAQKQGFGVGDMVSIVTAQPAQRFRVTGIARLGGASLGGATFAVFPLVAAEALYLENGRVDQVAVTAQRGWSASELITEITPLLTPELVVRSAQSQAGAEAAGFADRLGILTDGLFAFGFIAVFLGGFAIFNTFSMTIAERMGEFALLRALGATRPQVLGSVLLEAAAIGLVASLLGLAGGFLAATLIRALFGAIGLSLPSAGIAFHLRTAEVGLGVGLLVTIAATLVPALRATRVAPLQAIRADQPPRRVRRRTAWIRAAVTLALIAGGLVLALTGSGSASQRLTRSAIGAGVIVLAIVAIGPMAISRAVRVVGWPLERRGRILGRLARENATRNSARTAATASSLMIGLAAVLFVVVYANGLRASTNRIIDRTLTADYTLESTDGATPIPPATVQSITALPQVQGVASLTSAQGHLGRSGLVTAQGVDPSTFGQVYRFDWVHGAPAVAGLLPGDVLVEQDTARSAHLSVGQRVTMTTGTGVQSTVTVRGIYRDNALLQGYVLPISAFNRLFHQPRIQAVFVRLMPGTNKADAGIELGRSLRAFPGIVARSTQQVKNVVAGRVNSVLALFYALLALVVTMSLLGIVNTLSLSLYERTRELGMLRALGMTPEQTRTLIRDESIITAALGALAGVVLGVGLAVIVTVALAGDGVVFALPVVQVLGLLALGLVAGVAASVLPARRAVRLDVLAAISQE
ncbi:MAG: putative transport system permease protein [Solirubrobacteraceae bacterium]|nr:putative transport system permease protein [Solirubrobacteraceae bacterium]